VVALVLFYAIQLYADFTGGIDITIGVAQMLGIEVAENFDRPFFSLNITEYWRRWHITMGTWFRDYIFYPISVSPRMLKISKWSRDKLGQAVGKRVPVYLSTIIVWFVTGLWHGAAWNFIVWGLLNCLVIIVSQELAPLYSRFHKRFKFSNTRGYNVFQMFRTFWLMGFIRVLDVYRDVPATFRQVGTVFTHWNWGRLFDGSFLKLGLDLQDFVVVLLACGVMLAVSIMQNKGQIRDRLIRRPAAIRAALFILILLLIVVFGAYGIGYDAGQFIYVQF
ncbi:MAG: MBOAT family protein, partial [Clostridia bacterium]|nr:MBOAT family protein [Clostridia bacterium]